MLRQDWIEQGLTSPPTQYRLSGRQFYRWKDPTSSIKVLKEKLAIHRPEEAPNPPGASHHVTSEPLKKKKKKKKKKKDRPGLRYFLNKYYIMCCSVYRRRQQVAQNDRDTIYPLWSSTLHAACITHVHMLYQTAERMSRFLKKTFLTAAGKRTSLSAVRATPRQPSWSLISMWVNVMHLLSLGHSCHSSVIAQQNYSATATVFSNNHCTLGSTHRVWRC